MKIALISHTFLPNIGGIEVYTYRLARDLKKIGEEIYVLSTDFGIKKKGRFSFPVYYFKAWPVILRNPFSFSLFLHLLKNQYNVIHLQSMWFFLVFWAHFLAGRQKLLLLSTASTQTKLPRLSKLASFVLNP